MHPCRIHRAILRSEVSSLMVGLVVLKEPFHIHGGHTSFASSYDGLAVVGVAHIAGGKHTRHIRCARGICNADISLFVQFHLSFEEGCVGRMANGDEESGYIDMASFSGFHILQVGS